MNYWNNFYFSVEHSASISISSSSWIENNVGTYRHIANLNNLHENKASINNIVFTFL